MATTSASLAGSSIDVAGVRVEELLAASKSADVYLASYESDDSLIVVKVLKTLVRNDDDRYRRLNRVWSLMRQMSHPNVVKTYEHQATPERCYTIMEYLPGGTLHDRMNQGIRVQPLIKVVKDIARALDYVHQLGLIHCDVKPENILFRANGTAVLADFGIAQLASEAATPTRGARIWGTPEYASPEQIAGRALDARSDLYSLGVVLYRVLTGGTPYTATDPLSIGLKQLQDPIPRLPAYLNEFQTIMDKALAKRPEQRFASGAELVQALDEIRGDLSVEGATFKSDPISTREIERLTDDVFSTQRDPVRQERRTRKRQSRRLRTSLLSLLFLVSVGAGVYYAYTNDLLPTERMLAELGIGEDPVVARAWAEAQSIRQDPNQGLSAIVAAHRRVLELDAGHAPALEGVATLASEWKANIDAALNAGNLEQAEARLNEARAVFPDDADWLLLDTRLQNRYRAERLMVSTEALLTSHGMSDQPSAAAAIQSYQEVLRLAPGHDRAKLALENIAVHYARLASEAAEEGRVSEAIGLLERAASADQTLAALDDVRTSISQATNTQAAIEELLQQAASYRAADQLIAPVGENAAEFYHRVLATDPDNVIAQQGLDEVAAQVSASATALLGSGDLGAVDILVNQASTAGLSEDKVEEIRGRLRQERNRQTVIVTNLEAARALMEQGYLTAPASNNAVARLREVQRVDSNNEEARTLLRECAQRLADVAGQAHRYGLRDEARQYLALALTITPQVAEWVELQQRWETE